MKLIAITDCYINSNNTSIRHEAGSEFECGDDEAGTFIRAGAAKRADMPTAPVPTEPVAAPKEKK